MLTTRIDAGDYIQTQDGWCQVFVVLGRGTQPQPTYLTRDGREYLHSEVTDIRLPGEVSGLN